MAPPYQKAIPHPCSSIYGGGIPVPPSMGPPPPFGLGQPLVASDCVLQSGESSLHKFEHSSEVLGSTYILSFNKLGNYVLFILA